MQTPSEIKAIGLALRGYYWTAGLFSLAMNLLYLAGPLYVLQVYDRVMASGSVMTLAMLTILLLLAYGAHSVTVNPQDLAQSPSVTLYPGMPASVMIATEERTALQYLPGPLTASFDQSFRER